MPTTRETEILTLAAIRKPKGEEGTEYLFNEREQIFVMRSTLKSAEQVSGQLKHALRTRAPVRAVLDPRRGLVEKIEIPSPKELEEFRERRVLLDKPNKAFRINVATIDPTRFNLADYYLKIPTFRLCTRIVPGYASAKNIFDFCADQSCHLPGPYSIAPCIPFQYAIDGCYARAHKMRWIITTRFHYCCEKVFSFANQGSDRLRVKADKWGGCCVSWWYHVAPLIRVRVKLGRWSIVLAMVIDPSMFDKPVLLSSWLAAQENATCGANAHVSTYSIQPGSAYAPANYSGTSFTTDPSYVATDNTLTNYSGLTTCP